MGYGGWPAYVSVAERRRKAEKAAAKAKKNGAELSPIETNRGAIAKTFWGKSWCSNLEQYSDYANRLPRGRTYVRNGSVIDLKITAGEVRAQVMGSSLYTVDVTVTAVPDKQWQAIGAGCAGSINSLVELLQGKLSKGVMEQICQPGTGLFPAPKEIKFKCSCPDWASMCKHVAAVLYGIGARLDQQPELLFSLRQVDAKDLVAQAGAGLSKTKKIPTSKRLLEDTSLADVFGIEIGEVVTPVNPAAKKNKERDAQSVKISKKPATDKSTANTGTSPKPKPTSTLKKVVKAKSSSNSKLSNGKTSDHETKIESTFQENIPKSTKRTKKINL